MGGVLWCVWQDVQIDPEIRRHTPPSSLRDGASVCGRGVATQPATQMPLRRLLGHGPCSRRPFVVHDRARSCSLGIATSRPCQGSRLGSRVRIPSSAPHKRRCGPLSGGRLPRAAEIPSRATVVPLIEVHDAEDEQDLETTTRCTIRGLHAVGPVATRPHDL
jgi:hypothetical protein